MASRQYKLVIYETHPFLEMFDPNAAQAFTPTTSYFTKEPFVSEAVITYDGTNGGITPASYWFVRTMGDILTACAGAGLMLERLTEHPHSNREVEYDQYERREPQLPLCFTLVARKRQAFPLSRWFEPDSRSQRKPRTEASRS